MIRWFRFLKTNRLGTIIGITYPAVSWMLFAFGFSFGEGCNQDLILCNPVMEFARPWLSVFGVPNVAVFSMIFYFGIQTPAMFLFGQQQGAPVNPALVLIILIPITILIWTAFGSLMEWLVKDIRNRLA